MEVNDCCKKVVKTIVDKMKSSNRIMLSVLTTPAGNREIRIYTPTGLACGSKSTTMADYDDLTGKGITGMVEIDIDKLVRNQGGA